METLSYVALSGQMSLRTALDTVANNLANMNTSGFKAQRTIYKEFQIKNKVNPRSLRVPTSYVQDVAQYQNFSQGPLIKTGNPLDFAIRAKDGFFQVTKPDGSLAYTRAGSFTLNNLGQLTTHDGYSVTDDGGAPITFPADVNNITVSNDGVITADGTPIATMGIYTFSDLQQLNRNGQNFYVPPNTMLAQAVPKGLINGYGVVQGAVEGSNVSGVAETVRMLEVSRAYTKLDSLLSNRGQQVGSMMDSLIGKK